LLIYLFKLSLVKKTILLNPKEIRVEYKIKEYIVGDLPLLFPLVRIYDLESDRIFVDIICFEKIKIKKEYSTSIISLLN
jgi:hypothetical protein